MENATKALLIAAGILFTVAILALAVQMKESMRNTEEIRVNREDAFKLQEWNAEWEAYNKKLLYGSEVVTVMNKAEQNNEENNYNANYAVIIYVNGEVKNKSDINSDDIFKCVKMNYHIKTGRIWEIYFENR